MLVEIQDAEAARAAQAAARRASSCGMWRSAPRPTCRCSPYGPRPDDAAAGAADAVVLSPADGDEAFVEHVERCHELGIEYVVRVSDDEELAHALDHVDPEVVLLTAERAEDEQAPIDRLLELLPDVPAGKLAIAELADAPRGGTSRSWNAPASMPCS